MEKQHNAKCRTCGKSFYRDSWLLKRYKNHYCSLHCRDKFLNPTGKIIIKGNTGLDKRDYEKIHRWVRKKYGYAQYCENIDCTRKSKTFQWALKRGYKYEKKINNFIQLCVPCHKKYDMTDNVRENISNGKKQNLNWNTRAVIKIDLSGKELDTYKSISEAGRMNNLTLKAIHNALNGVAKTSGGYKWKYLS